MSDVPPALYLTRPDDQLRTAAALLQQMIDSGSLLFGDFRNDGSAGSGILELPGLLRAIADDVTQRLESQGQVVDLVAGYLQGVALGSATLREGDASPPASQGDYRDCLGLLKEA